MTERLRFPSLCSQPKPSVDDKVEGLESGADAYLTKPTQPRELLAQVKALLARAQKAPVVKPEPAIPVAPIRGYVVGVLAAKGGLGVSSLATNLAVSIQKLTRDSVVVADFTPGSGDISLSLGFTANGAAQLLRKDAKMITTMDIQKHVLTHDSGIHFLPAPQRPRDAIYGTRVDQFKTIAQQLPSMAKFIVLDLGSALSPVTQAILEDINEFLVVAEPTPLGVQQTKALIDDLDALGVAKNRIRVALVNRQRTSMQLNWSDVQEAIQHPIATVITPAPDLAYKATEIHVPMVVQQPTSLTAEQYTKLASTIIQH